MMTLTIPMSHFVPADPRVGAGALAPLREGHVPRLLCQEGAVEEAEDAELGQRGGPSCMQQHTITVFLYASVLIIQEQ